jgi:hypothetical protein
MNSFDDENVTALSGIIRVCSGMVIGRGAVVGIEVTGDSVLVRDLNENFCFGTFFDFSADSSSDNSFSC